MFPPIMKTKVPNQMTTHAKKEKKISSVTLMLEKNVYLPGCFSFLQDSSLRHLTSPSRPCKPPLESLPATPAAGDGGGRQLCASRNALQPP